MLTYANLCYAMLTYANLCYPMLTYALRHQELWRLGPNVPAECRG